MNCPICNNKMKEVKDERGRIWAICSYCPNGFIIRYLAPPPVSYGDKVATEVL